MAGRTARNMTSRDARGQDGEAVGAPLPAAEGLPQASSMMDLPLEAGPVYLGQTQASLQQELLHPGTRRRSNALLLQLCCAHAILKYGSCSNCISDIITQKLS